MGNKLGVIISFVISLILLAPQIRSKDFNLMDITSLLYFSIAIAAMFIFDLKIFVEKSGFLAYSTLFLMALEREIVSNYQQRN